jgi:hypothetical protein
MGHHVRKYIGLSSVDAGNKEIVPCRGKRGEGRSRGELLFDPTLGLHGDERHMGYLL